MIRTMIGVGALVAALGIGSVSAVAQQGQRGQGGQGGPGRNFDPAQMQQRMAERWKEILEITDDQEWNAMQPLIQKVTQARMASFGGMGRGMMAMRPQRGGDDGPGQGGPGAQGGGRRFGPEPMPEAEALQKAIDAKASKAEVKAALDKYQAARQAKQAELEQAQANLRKVLTTRQEAIATLNGLL